MQQIYAIISASSSVKSSKKFRSVLEVILAFGNYLNSSKRGPAYGFKLQSLDTLMDTKSTDKKSCLMHYIVATIRQNFPELMGYDSELFSIDKASQVSLENVVTDVNELEKGMEVVRKEAELKGKGPHNHVLKDFLTNSEEKLKKIRHELKSAQVKTTLRLRAFVIHYNNYSRMCSKSVWSTLVSHLGIPTQMLFSRCLCVLLKLLRYYKYIYCKFQYLR